MPAGNDTPAILVENTTAANRAVNIPEFVNLPPDGLESIDPQATEFTGCATRRRNSRNGTGWPKQSRSGAALCNSIPRTLARTLASLWR